MLEFLKRAAEKNAFNPGWTCAYCGREIVGGGYFCRECAEKLPFNDGEICAHCGRELDAPQDYCYTCAGRLTAFDAGRSAFVYEGIVSALIRKFKYGNARYLAKVFAPYLANVYYGSFAAADAVAYVPMLKKDQRKRGFNQTELLAREFSALTGLRVISAAEKRRPTAKQAALDRADRLKNMENTFRVADKAAVAGLNILILDDVTTTGATANALAAELKKSGADKVFVLTVASVSGSERKKEKQAESGAFRKE